MKWIVNGGVYDTIEEANHALRISELNEVLVKEAKQ